MKRILKLSVRTIAIVAAFSLVAFALSFERETHAGQIINNSNGGITTPPRYTGNYPAYGQGPYAYGSSGGNGYQTYGSGSLRIWTRCEGHHPIVLGTIQKLILRTKWNYDLQWVLRIPRF